MTKQELLDVLKMDETGQSNWLNKHGREILRLVYPDTREVNIWRGGGIFRLAFELRDKAVGKDDNGFGLACILVAKKLYKGIPTYCDVMGYFSKYATPIEIIIASLIVLQEAK